MFSNWFSKKKPDVEDLEEIKITPEIIIPEPTRRELYDLAVEEVQQLRVQELIKRELAEMCLTSQALASTKACIELYGRREFNKNSIEEIRADYQGARCRYAGDSMYIFAIPEATIDGVIRALATKYLAE